MDEFRDLLTNKKEEANVFLVGVPFDGNASVGKGTSHAPKVLRELSYALPALDRLGNDLSKLKLYDLGDIEVKKEFLKLHEDFKNVLYKEIGFHFIFGGDHSIAIGSESAFFDYAKSLGKEPVIIHIDAHPDICDVYEDSKFSHACPIFRSLEYGFKDENITLVGIRGFEAQEIETFKKHPKLDVFKAEDVKKMGVETLISYLRTKYRDPKYLIYISYDIDANDPAYAPGTGTPEAFGLTNEQTREIITSIVRHLNVDSLDIVEVAPPLDINNITSWLALKTLYEVFYELLQKPCKS